MSSSMDDAITRVDTMNNFPNVMKNLGISTKDSQKAIDKMSKKLEGLPTTLDAGARAVQRFASKNEDVNKSTDMFLAFNNALLAGGASADIQASALEQVSQAYAKGRPDMVEWRSVLTAMPAQANQLGKAFGMTSEQLGTALREGDISMDQFMQKIMELNKKGVKGFDNFEVQARRATNGLRTNVINLKTALVRGMANAFNSLNESLQKSNLPTIQEMLLKMTKKITDAFKVVNKAISKINWKSVIKALKILIPIVAVLYSGFMAYKAVVGVLRAVAMAQMLLNSVMLLNPIGLFVAGIVMLIATFVILWKKCEGFRNFWIGLWNGIKTITIGVIDWFKELPENVSKIVDSIIDFLKNLPYYIGYMLGWIVGKIIVFHTKTIPNMIKSIIKWFTTLPEKIWKILILTITKVVEWKKNLTAKGKEAGTKLVKAVFNAIKTLPSKMLEIGKDIVKGLWNGIKGMKDWVTKKIKSFAKGVVDGMKKALGIHSPSKEFAIIGRYSIIGYQEGLEKMKPELDKAINGMFNLSPTMTGTMNNTISPNVNVVNNVNVETDPLGQVVSKIKTFSGGAKNDYNYGYGG